MIKFKQTIVVMLIAIPTVMLFSGCKKFLDRKPLQGTADDLQVGALTGDALGIYGGLRNSAAEPYIGDGFEGIAWVAMNGFRSDDAEIVADPGASAWHQTYDLFQYTKDDWGAGLYWDKHYVLIGQCNKLIAKAATQNLTDPASLINVAEAKFFRAYSYFDLVRTFGEVPKIDSVISSVSGVNVAKSTVPEIYAFIDADLTYAEQYLPVSWLAEYAGRATSGAAKTMHAKTLLYRQQWAPALNLCTDVITSHQYSLFAPYYKIFKQSGELCSESIFEVQASKTSGDGNTYWSRFGQCQGVRGASGTAWDLGWGWNTPTADLESSYEAGDVRKQATILYSNQFDGGESTGGYGNTVPNLTNALYWNKKVYSNYNDYLAAGLGTPNNEAQNTFVNHRVLRYADVLLMAAEAANEIGGAGNGNLAAGWVNEVRARANLGAISFVDQAQMRTAIKKERRSEFAMEFERFFDLVRWNDAITVLAPLGYQNKHRYYPIPNSALNGNTLLVQNPEWP